MGVSHATSVTAHSTVSWEKDGLQPGFADRETNDFAIGVVGDIHLEPDQMHLFWTAKEQLGASLGRDSKDLARLIQLGDLGGYNHGPGGRKCLKAAKEFIESFKMPAALVAGNHDLEGAEFETDEANLEAWQQTLRQRHYWSARVGRLLCLGLSTVKFRSNKDSVHEVHIDAEQIDWFKRQLQEANGDPIAVFTHAPPMGCGLKVVEAVHVRNRCAWLNHSGDAEVFIDLVKRYPNIRLWFSGHYHLSQNYEDSISVRNNCSFVQVGVIGDCGRDGQHQSRILRGDKAGFKVLTFDHATGSEREDIAQGWGEQMEQPTLRQAHWPASLPFTGDKLTALEALDGEEWYGAGGDCVLRRLGKLLVEYRADYQAAVGLVFADIDGEDTVQLIDEEGKTVQSKASCHSLPQESGETATEVLVVDQNGKLKKQISRNEEGTFFQIFQRNKWRAQQQEKCQQLANA